MAIPTSTLDTEVVSTLGGQRGKFSVHAQAHEKIMGVLTNLYEDPENAVIREYSTNALDSQIEAQAADPNYVWRPIEVTTPSHFNKTFKIRDFGVGMTVKDIENVYSQYGYSTKEHTNDQTGMLGLGSKCGLTYTGQFTITGFKNGIKTTALITLNEDEVPEYVILDTAFSDEPNGVEISIPVKSRDSFAEKCSSFFRWWKSGQVLVNGTEPVKHGYTEVEPGVYLVDHANRYYDSIQSYVIMGNVPYAVEAEYIDAGLREVGMGFAAYVPMGTVDFPPSRERLRYNTRTKAAIRELSAGLFEKVLQTKIDDVINAPDYRTAWQRKAALPYAFARNPLITSLKYKGEPFTERVQAHHYHLDWDWQGHGQISERQWINFANTMNGSLIVTDVTSKSNSYFKKKVKQYISDNSIDAGHAILVKEDIDNKWLEWVPRVDAADIKKVKLPSTPSNTPRRTDAPYDYYYLGADGKVVEDSNSTITVPKGKTMVHISPQDMRETYPKPGTYPQNVIRTLGEDYVLVVLGRNRFDKFLRTHKSTPVADAFKKQAEKYMNSITDAEYVIGNLSYSEDHFLQKVNPDSLKDKELSDIARLLQDKNRVNNFAKAQEVVSLARRASIAITLPPRKDTVQNPCKGYPLIDLAGHRNLADTTLYCNAVYDHNNGTYDPNPGK